MLSDDLWRLRVSGDLDRLAKIARDIQILKWVMLALLFLVFLLVVSTFRAATLTTSSGLVVARSVNVDGQRQ